MSKIDANDNLTDKQRAACDYKLAGMTDIDAAIKAGYSKATAHSTICRTFQLPAVKEYLQTKLSKIDNKRIKSIEEVQEWWGDIMDGKVKDVVTRWNEDEQEYEDLPKHPSLQERIKVSEFIVKSQAGFTDKVEHSGAVPVMIVDDINE